MDSYHLIVSIVFRIINLLILVAIGAYIFQRHMFKQLKERYADYKQQLRFLRTRTRSLEKEKDELATLIEQDSALCQQLKKRVAVWQRTVKEEAAMQADEHAAYIAAIKKRSAIQEEQLTLNVARKTVMPTVIQKLQSDMAKTFADGATQQRYLKKIVGRLGRNR